ncbi:hypothetical protein TNCV_3876411 [Trichonephila clavipes]|uniref:Tc1-like transposase DDE domain-containing protein n=1 Tax=Trichonephila clavipes TaxID=2585209 RepID=A0A8X6VR59_TRICX|nr:hypothetical protein TNCV_3876411 [Trichonephila clavipes]
MEWPTCSPDMNPIEYVLDSLGRRVVGRQPPPQTPQEFWKSGTKYPNSCLIASLTPYLKGAQRCWPSVEIIPRTENDFL